jgi:hypothetical protein
MGRHPRRRSGQLDQIVKVDVRSMNGTAVRRRDLPKAYHDQLISQPQEDDYFFNSLLESHRSGVRSSRRSESRPLADLPVVPICRTPRY